MSLTKIGSIGINTGIQFAGVTTVSSLQAGAATTIHSTGIDLGSGNINSHNINSTGIITATSFVGSGSGLTGVASTDNIRTNTNATFLQNINVSGTSTIGGDVTVNGGDLTVTGTNPIIHLTDTDENSDYQLNVNGGVFQVYDYTNTAGRLLIASDGTVSVPNDLSLADKIIHTGDTNTALRFPAADTVTVETGGSERIRVDSAGRLGVGQNSPTALLHLKSNAPYITFEDDDNNQDWQIQATAWFAIRDQTNSAERLRIDSSGRVLIGTTTEGVSTADDLTVANSGHGGITIRTGTSSLGNLYFSDGTSGDDEYRGVVQYDHSGDFMRFLTNASERLRITSDGAIGLSGTNYGSSGQVLTSGGSGSAVSWTTVSGTTINNNANNKVITGSDTANTLEGESYIFGNSASLSIGTQSPAYLANLHIRNSYASMRIDSDGSNNDTTFLMKTGTNTQNKIHFGDAADDDVGIIKYDHNGDHMVFVTGTTERMRLNQYGLCIGGTGDANALDDYEEGSFTTSFVNGANYSIQSGTNRGQYIKVGQVVYVRGYIRITSVTNGQSWYPDVGGLPFTSDTFDSLDTPISVMGLSWSYGSGITGMVGQILGSSTTVRVRANRYDGHGYLVTANNMTNSSRIWFSGSYRVS